MNHIDEGTIHAWLDGALSADEAAQVESHVAQCASCSAAVAEARGLIAGASRILMALDDVPGNVVPKRAAGVAPAVTAPIARRRWRAAPWVTGIAAALILAVGVTTMKREPGRMASSLPAVAPTEVAMDSATASVAAPPSVSPTAPSAGTARSGLSGGTASGGGARAGASEGVAVSGPQVATSRKSTRERDAATQTAPSQRPMSQLGKAVEREAMKRDDAALADLARAGTVASVAAVDSTPMRVANQSRSELRAEALSVSIDSAATSVALAGCYRLGAPDQRQSAGLAQRAAAAAASARTRAAAPAPSAPAAPERAQFADQSAPTMVRLDTTESRVGFIARDQVTNAYLGTWQRVGDSVRVDLLARGVFTMAAKDRVVCPER